MHFLITGSAGFLGSHVSRYLIENGIRVTLVDRFSDYYSVDLKRRRAEELHSNFGVGTLDLDLSKSDQIQQLYKLQFSHLIHLAGQPGVRVTPANQLTYLSDNITSFSNIMDLAVRLRVSNFIYASSSSIYQKALTSPFNERESLQVPTNFYAKTKYLNERIAESFMETVPNICGLRFFSVYGPWGRPDMAYFKLFQAAYSGSDFPLNGDGEISRDFTFVGDVITSISKLINSEGIYPQILNIGGGNVHKMNELIATIHEITGKEINVSRRPSDVQDLQTTKADTALQEERLGGFPSTSLYDGLSTINSWINSLNNKQEFLNWR